MKGNDILDLIKLIKKCATGRGTSSIVIDGQRLMNMVLLGESPSMVLKTINEFTEAVEQLKDNRDDKQIVQGLLNGIFITLFAPCKSLDNQIEKIMESSNQSTWEEMAKVFLLVLTNRMHAKSALVKRELDNGMIEANLSQYEYSKMICFKCGKKGHSAKACNKSDYSICTICKKLHHVNAHEAYTSIKDRKEGSEPKIVDKYNNNNNKFNNKYKSNINANDTRIYDGNMYDEEGYDETGRLEKLFEGMRAELNDNNDVNSPYIYDDPEDTYESETVEGMISEVIDTSIIKDPIEKDIKDHKKDISINKEVNYNEIINNLSDLFIDVRNNKKIRSNNKDVSHKSLKLSKIDRSQE